MSHTSWLGLLLVAFISFSAHSFSNEKCGSLFPKTGGSHYPWLSPLYVSTMVPSTSSYFSSFGACSMYGQDGISARQVFMHESKEQVEKDAARGHGEYLNALAGLSGCPEDKYGKFSDAVHSQFDSIFSEQSDSNEVVQKVDTLVNTHPELKNVCKNQTPFVDASRPAAESRVISR